MCVCVRLCASVCVCVRLCVFCAVVARLTAPASLLCAFHETGSVLPAAEDSMNVGKLLFISLLLSLLGIVHCRPQYGEYDFEPRDFPPPAYAKGGNPSDPGIWWAQRLLAGGAVSLQLLLWFRSHRREAIPRMTEVTELISQLLTQHDRNRPCMERCLRNKVDSPFS